MPGRQRAIALSALTLRVPEAPVPGADAGFAVEARWPDTPHPQRW